MRKILALMLILILTAGMVLTLASCGSRNGGSETGQPADTQTDPGAGQSSDGSGQSMEGSGQSSGGDQQSGGSDQQPSSGGSLGVPSTEPGRRGSFAAIETGGGVLANNAGKADSQLLWYADECWYVIGYDGSGSRAARSGAVTLFLTDYTDRIGFAGDPNSADANVYSESALRSAMNGLLANGANAIFHSREQCAVLGRELKGGSSDYGTGGYDASLIKGGPVLDLLWPLSSYFAESLPPSVRTAESARSWWLSSPGDADSKVQTVTSTGDMNYPGRAVTDTCGVRPAFDLDISSILFTSAAGGKATGSLGPDALTEVSRSDSGQWKVTLEDDGTNPQLTGHRDFALGSVITCDGSALKIEYSGAKTGSNEYISAIVKDANGNIKYYGRLAQASSASGTVSVNVGGKLPNNCSLYLFNEQYNGGNATDYASALKEVSIPANPHHNWKDATCTAPSTCSTCGATQGDPLGHVWKDATCTEAKTCTRCGATDGGALGHTWEIKSCTEPRYCSRCGAAESSAVGHDWKDATCTEPKTCRRCGATEGTALGHSWKEADCTEPKTCTRCGKTEGSALGHSWNEGAVTKEPTCTDKGVKTFTCRNDSSHTKTEDISALGHVWGEWTVTKEPEVGVEGVEEHTCSRCGIKEARGIPALKEYTVTFETNGGSEVAAQAVIENKTAAKPADPVKDGFTFTGWYQDSECTSGFDFSKAITADTTVYAGWIEKGQPIPAVYTAAEGDNGTWTKGSGETYKIVVTRSIDEASCFDHYKETLIDGKKADVSARSGSTVVEIGSGTLEKLSAGAHKITVRFDDGEANVSLTVKDAEVTPPEPPGPEPDKDGSGNLLWLILIPVVLIGAGAGFALGRRKSGK